MKHDAKFTKDPNGTQLHVSRAFDAPVAKVWKAWTQADILDKWWGPKPWRAETKSLDFRPGGNWHYAMVGPNGDRHWCLVGFLTIETEKSFKSDASFCDENRVINSSLPIMHWFTRFSPTTTGTMIDVTLTFDRDVDLKAIVDMGFEAGFSMGLGNLDEVLAE